jgi:hypothetical protein
MRFDIARNTCATIDEYAAKPGDVDVPDILRLGAERRQRVPRVRAISQRGAQNTPLRREVSQLHANQFAQPRLQAAPVATPAVAAMSRIVAVSKPSSRKSANADSRIRRPVSSALAVGFVGCIYF